MVIGIPLTPALLSGLLRKKENIKNVSGQNDSLSHTQMVSHSAEFKQTVPLTTETGHYSLIPSQR